MRHAFNGIPEASSTDRHLHLSYHDAAMLQHKKLPTCIIDSAKQEESLSMRCISKLKPLCCPPGALMTHICLCPWTSGARGAGMLLMSICGVWTASTLIMMVKGVIDCGWRVDSQICCLLEKLRRSIQIVIGMPWLRPAHHP